MKLRMIGLFVLGMLFQLNTQKLYAFEYEYLSMFDEPSTSRVIRDVKHFSALFNIAFFVRLIEISQFGQLKKSFPEGITKIHDSLYEAYDNRNKDGVRRLIEEITDEREYESLTIYSELNKQASYFKLVHSLLFALVLFKKSTIDYLDNSSANLMKVLAIASIPFSIYDFIVAWRHKAINELVKEKKVEFCINYVDEEKAIEAA